MNKPNPRNLSILSITLMLFIPLSAESMTSEMAFSTRKVCDMKQFYDYTLSYIKNLEELDLKIKSDIKAGIITREQGKIIFQEAIKKEDDEIFRKRQVHREKLKNLDDDLTETMNHLRFELTRQSALAVFFTQTRPNNEIRLKKMLNDQCKELANLLIKEADSK